MTKQIIYYRDIFRSVNMNICVYGSASDKIDDIYKDAAYELGSEIAKHGHTLVFGGGDFGMMGACVRGVHDNGGKAIGVAPHWIGDSEGAADDCDEFYFVETMDERKNKFYELSDMFIITPGGLGTFDETFEILTLKQLKQTDKIVIIYNINGYFDPAVELVMKMSKEFFLDDSLVSDEKQIARLVGSKESLLKYF